MAPSLPTVRRLALALIIAGLVLSACAQALDRPSHPLAIEAASGTVHRFSVELADSERTRKRGLMFRRTLGPREGMLFDFRRQAPVAMWMVNTFIALDILFIDAHGEIVAIAEAAEPLSNERIRSGVPVRAVLEVNAGVVEALGIQPGDRVRHPIFGGSAQGAQRRAEALE